MKQETIDQLAAADVAMAKAAFMLKGPYVDEAGRHAYYAMFHAANALIVERGFKPPKTHRGLHQLFARATQTEPALVSLVALLGDSYSFKWDADYGPANSTITIAEAQHAIADATRFIATIRADLALPPAP